jgi:hypothetical protein
MKKIVSTSGFAMALLISNLAAPLFAGQYDVAGRPLNIMGYMSQAVQYGFEDAYDTEEGFNQALMTAFLEAEYEILSNMSFYGAGKATVDWIYDLKHSDHSWSEKDFSKSRSELYFDDEWWQLFHEGHLTWTPGSFLFRVGKQIVSWGEMDFLRVMDQINPLDSRRGFSDVEFESTVIPIPLIRAEWWPSLAEHRTFLDELGIQFVFNPNLDFISDQNPQLGNDVGGIWAPRFILDGINYGSTDSRINEPDRLDPEGFEYGARIQMLMGSAVVTLNGFYGRANTAVEKLDLGVVHPAFVQLSEALVAQGLVTPGEAEAIAAQGAAISPKTPITFDENLNPVFGEVDQDGNPIVHLALDGKYFRQKFVGGTVACEVPWLRFPALGGSAPVIRSEVKYEFERAFTELNNAPTPEREGFIKSDTLDVAAGLDWKFKINWLNPRAYLDTSWQAFYQYIVDYPNEATAIGTPAKIFDIPDEHNWKLSTYIQTQYFNSKLIPSFAFLWDIDNKAYLAIPSLSFSPTTSWKLTLTAGFMGGKEDNASFDVFENKDYVAFTIRRSF